MSSNAKTERRGGVAAGGRGAKSRGGVKEYLAGLAPERRKDLEKVRRLVGDALPDGYEEGFIYGMISWFVPAARCPRTYNGQPLVIVALASQKQYMALYLLGFDGDQALRQSLEQAYSAAGRKLDMGKSCLRFQSADELPLGALRKVLAAVDVDAFVAMHDEAHAGKRLKPVAS